MAKKNNIRSIRFTDELAELIEAQIGDTFTEKFENLVTRCIWELPKAEAELKRIRTEIERERKNLSELSTKARQYSQQLNDMQYKLENISRSIAIMAKNET